MRVVHGKLVRDGVPAILDERHVTYLARTASEGEVAALLAAKLVEEALEVARANRDEMLDELADVLEVAEALASRFGFTSSAVEARRQIRRAQRGGFDRAVVLEWTED